VAVDLADSGAAVPEAAAPVAAGSNKEFTMENPVPQNTIDEFVRRARDAAAANLEVIMLYGSAASGEYQPEFSNLNLLCVLRETSIESLSLLHGLIKWWDGQKQPPPLMMTRSELRCAADVFPIELIDMQQHRRVLFGDDPLEGLTISAEHHRTQVEYELREKLILLRQHVIRAAGNEKRLQEILLRSVSSIATLFRHALMVSAAGTPLKNREAIQALAKQVGFDPAAIEQALDIRQRKSPSRKLDIRELLAKYMSAVEQVIVAVDQAKC
jgi:hypothetical protein